MEVKTCGTCSSWFRIGTTNTGQCRKSPPVIGFVVVGFFRQRIERCTSFPLTEADAWCGEWKQAKAAA